MISLVNITKNLFESYGFNHDYGFVNDAFDERKPLYDILVSYSEGDIELALARKKDTKETYIFDINEVPYEYYQGFFEWVNDDDPDFDDENSWEDAYREFDDETQLFNDGLSLYVEDLIDDADLFTTDVNEMLNNNDKLVLKITPENKADVYREFHDLIQAYLEPTYEERINNKKGS